MEMLRVHNTSKQWMENEYFELHPIIIQNMSLFSGVYTQCKLILHEGNVVIDWQYWQADDVSDIVNTSPV